MFLAMIQHLMLKTGVLRSDAAAFPAEYTKICTRTAVGFIVMGFIGFFVKLIFIVRAASASLTLLT